MCTYDACTLISSLGHREYNSLQCAGAVKPHGDRSVVYFSQLLLQFNIELS